MVVYSSIGRWPWDPVSGADGWNTQMQTILNTNNTPAGGDTPVSPSSGILLYIQLNAKQSKVNIELGTQTREKGYWLWTLLLIASGHIRLITSTYRFLIFSGKGFKGQQEAISPNKETTANPRRHQRLDTPKGRNMWVNLSTNPICLSWFTWARLTLGGCANGNTWFQGMGITRSSHRILCRSYIFFPGHLAISLFPKKVTINLPSEKTWKKKQISYWNGICFSHWNTCSLLNFK